ncbi:MAG: hypothetical protein ACKKMR_01270 [Candidatus Nealsonbacteria bacterium]
MIEEVTSYFKKEQTLLQREVLSNERKKREIELFLMESSSSFWLKLIISKLLSKVQSRKINKELISLKERITTYEKARLELRRNDYKLAIQLIDKEIDELFTISSINSSYPEMMNVIFKLRLPSEFCYLQKIRDRLVYFHKKNS